MKKILLHLSNENEYKAFTKALVKNNHELQIMGSVVHGTLFDISHKSKPDIVILPTNEYTQEFHDYITEYHKSQKIILFTNNTVVNTNIINFWNQTKTTIVAKKTLYPEQQPNYWISYDHLYDSDIYYNMNILRNNKIAVLLSDNDEKNHILLDKHLYPSSNEKLVLFNSTTFQHPQNVGLLRPEDACQILNTYNALLDMDDKFIIEARVCGISNLSLDGDIAKNITEKILKPTIDNLTDKSYTDFVAKSFLPIL